MLHMAELLIHSDDVPLAARAALSSALAGPRDQRRENLTLAARILHQDSGLDCEDACELVGLADDCGCSTAEA
jgi:hypothetical protein